TLNKYVLVERHNNPVLESVAEKAERIIESWRKKTKDFVEVYKESAALFNEIDGNKERQRSLGFTDFEFAVLLALEEAAGGSDELAYQVKDLCRRIKEQLFPDWNVQSSARKNVGKEIREFVRKLKLKRETLNKVSETLYERTTKYGEKD
ncbi:MAG: DUF3387 domain-containing protein, partial [Deltaproteobacteria bacterium]|nr:DUF3387 domain-containing protein [Deltaproteobacteria bacterium]